MGGPFRALLRRRHSFGAVTRAYPRGAMPPNPFGIPFRSMSPLHEFRRLGWMQSFISLAH